MVSSTRDGRCVGVAGRQLLLPFTEGTDSRSAFIARFRGPLFVRETSSSVRHAAYQPLDEELRRVERAATRGARSVTHRGQDVKDSVAIAIRQWEAAVIIGKPVADLESWAFRVGANAAKKACESCIQTVDTSLLESRPVAVVDDDEVLESLPGRAAIRRLLRAALARRRKNLKGRQIEVVLKLAQPAMSLKRAAKELGMDPSNLRRAFRRALRRLRARKSDLPPPP